MDEVTGTIAVIAGAILSIVLLVATCAIYNDKLIKQYIGEGMDPFTAKCLVSSDPFSCGKAK